MFSCFCVVPIFLIVVLHFLFFLDFMKYTIWRVNEDGYSFQLVNLGASSNKELALEKARKLNERLKKSEPNIKDRFVVKDEKNREIKDLEFIK